MEFKIYEQKLRPYRKSSSFFFCLRKFLKDKKIESCFGKLHYTKEFLEIFQEDLKTLLKNQSTTIEQMRKLFIDFENIEVEVEILSNFLNQEQSEYLFDILHCLKSEQIIKRVCKGLAICIDNLDLFCESKDIIGEGVFLSQETPVKTFCTINKTINDLTSKEQRLQCYEILAEFEDSEELIEFVFARNRVEVDLMKKIVSDEKEVITK